MKYLTLCVCNCSLYTTILFLCQWWAYNKIILAPPKTSHLHFRKGPTFLPAFTGPSTRTTNVFTAICTMAARSLNVATLPNADLAFLNKGFVSPAQYSELSAGAPTGSGSRTYIAIQNDVFLLGYSDGCRNGDLCISGPQRMAAKLQMQEYPVQVFPGTQVSMAMMSVTPETLNVHPLCASRQILLRAVRLFHLCDRELH